MGRMADERVFTVSGAKAIRAERVTLAEAGLLERQHLQEWVKEQMSEDRQGG